MKYPPPFTNNSKTTQPQNIMTSIMAITTPGAKASMSLKQELAKLNNYLLNFQKCVSETKSDATKLLICKELADTFLHMNVQKALKKMMKTNKTETQNLIRHLLIHNVNSQLMIEKQGFLQHYRHINEYFSVLRIFHTQVRDIHVVYGNIMKETGYPFN